MADPQFIAKGEFKSYKGRLTLYVFMICLVAGTGGLIIGYDIGISGGVTSMDSFLKKFFPSVYVKMKREESEIGNQYCKFDSQLLTTFTSSLYIAGLIASFSASAITRAFGRKVSMVTGGVSFFAGAVLNGAATNVAELIVGRIFLGFGVGFAGQAVPLYLSEMAPSNLRGALNICFQMFITVGILTANLVNYGTDQIKAGWGWRLSLGLAAVPAVIMTVGSVFFLPDTPSSLLERGHRERAMSSLRRLRGTEDVEDEFQDMVDASEASKLVNQPWRKILGRKYRAQLVMAMAIPFFQQITGINVVMFYAPVLFKTIGLGSSGSLMSAVITGLVNVVATFVSIFTVDRYGRRFLFIEGGIQMFICQVAIGIILGEKFGTSGNGQLSRGYANLVVLFICMYVSAFAWSWGPLGILVPSEIFPLEIRSVGQSINVSTNLLLTFAIAQAFLAMLCHLKFGLFFFFAGWVFIMTTFIYFFLPETKNIPIEEMAMVWKKHWFWGKILPDDDRYDGRGNSAGMEMDRIGN